MTNRMCKVNQFFIFLFICILSSLSFAEEHYGKILQSTDNGITWKSLGDFNHLVGSFLIDPLIPTTLYVSTGSWTRDGLKGYGIFKSIDGGITWQSINAGLPTQNSTLLAIDPTDSKRIFSKDNFDETQNVHLVSSLYRTKDGGLTWRNANLNEIGIVSVKINPVRSNTVYVSTFNRGVLKSTDGGETWTCITKDIGNKLPSYGLAIDPVNPNTVYIGAKDLGVYKTVNGGVSWTPSGDGLKNHLVYSFAIDPITPTTLYAGTDHGHGVFKSIDGGEKWHYTGLSGLGTVYIEINPQMPNNLYARTSKSSNLYRSKNGGATWETLTPGFDTFDFKALALDNSNTIYVGTHIFPKGQV